MGLVFLVSADVSLLFAQQNQTTNQTGGVGGRQQPQQEQQERQQQGNQTEKGPLEQIGEAISNIFQGGEVDKTIQLNTPFLSLVYKQITYIQLLNGS